MDFYEEIIIEKAKNPENEGIIKSPTIKYKDYNPLCGDEIEIYLQIEKGEIKEGKFKAEGCLISKLGANIAINQIKNQKINNLKKIEKDTIMKKIDFQISPSRIKCLMLGGYAIKKGIINHLKNKKVL